MRPLRIRLHAFGPYPGTVEVDFERLAAHGLFLVHGPTGAGKSTVLDAMTYALFGDDAKHGPERSGREFVSAHAPLARTSVEFEFSVGGDRFRVVRYPAQLVARARGGGPAGVEKPAEARLERLAPDGAVAEVLAEKTQEVSRAVQESLGCTVGQFRQTVVLPQGAFREVVTDEKARRAVLERLFDIERFARLTSRLKAAASSLRQEADLQRRAHDDVLARAGVDRASDLRGLRAEAASARDEAAERRGAREAELAERTDALRRGEALTERFARFDALAERLRELDAAQAAIDALEEQLAAADRAARLDPTERRRAATRATRAAAALRHEEATAAEAGARERRAAAAARRTAEEAREPERETMRALARRLADIETDVARLADQRAAQARHAAAADAHRDEAARHLAARGAADAEREDLERERADLRGRAAGVDALRAQRDAARERVDARAAIARLDERIALARETLVRSADDAGDDVLGLVRDHAAGLAAGALVDGAPCPVCGSPHHPHPHPAADGDPAALTALGVALERHRARTAQQAAQRERLESAEADRRVRAEPYGWLDDAPDPADLAGALAAADEALSTATAAAERLPQLDERLERLRREAATHAERAAAASLAAERERHEADAQRRDVDRTLSALPADARDPEAFTARLAAARAQADAAERALSAARDADATAATDLATATARRDERAAEFARAAHEARAAEDDFDAALRGAGFEDEAAYGAARLTEDAARSGHERVAAHREARLTAAGQVAALREELNGAERPDLDALRASWAAADARVRDAAGSAHEAQRRVDQLDAWLEELARADERHEGLRKRHAAATRLAQVAAGGVRGRPKVDLETFVLQRRFLDVLRLGNLHLRDMTGGRYSLHLVRDSDRASDTGLDLEVADHHVDGARRPARTLSGGEGFLAALSLALGLSDVAQRATHPIEALFIDEGFGSLDRDTLSLVTHTLRTLPRAAGRVVGIISHVDDLRRLIPVQLAVTPGERGSELRIEVNE